MHTGKRRTGGRTRPQDGDRAASVVEYVAALLVVAAIVAVLAGTSVGTTVRAGIQSAICRVAGGGCDVATGQPQPVRAQPSLLPTPPYTPGPDYRVEPTGPPPPGRAPSPPPTGPQTAPPPSEPPSPAMETQAVLEETALGRETLEWIRENDVPIVFRRGGGSYYSDDDNMIFIDLDQSPEERANVLVHEVNHAQHHDHPDPDEMGRQEFIDRSIDEETDGTVQQIQNNQQLQRARGNGTPPDTLMQAEYEQAYQGAHDRAYQTAYREAYDEAVTTYREERRETGKPPLTPEQLHRVADRTAKQAGDAAGKEAGERAGRQRVNEAFHNGEIRASTDGDTYPENYGDTWDAHN